jgi:hypothetical protein
VRLRTDLWKAEGHSRALLRLELSVLRKTTSWVVGLMLLGGASMVLIRAVSVGPASCGPQIMLYVTLPLSSHGGSSRPLYGLRIGEFRNRPTTMQLVAKPPTLRELINIQIDGRSDVRMEFGRRLVWNVTRGAFGRQSDSVLAIKVPIKGIRLSDGVNQEPWDLGISGMSALAVNPIQARQLDGERLVVANIVIPLRRTATDPRAAYVQLRPTVRFGNTQSLEAVLLPRGAEAR